MAFADGFEHDVFISYAHADNQPMDGSEGWVTAFVKRFRVALSQRLGGQLPDVYFDTRLQANQQLEDILSAVRGSALFLAVGSRAFIERQWTNLELSTFASTGASTARIFLIECMPPWPDQQYPSPIRTHRRLQFYLPAGPEEKVEVPLSPANDSARFNQLVHDVAHWVSEALRLVKNSSRPAAASAEPPELSADSRTVLIAQVTDDLEDEAASLRRYLVQFGIRVLPEQAYPQGGHEFAEAFQRDIDRADIFVQLLGPRPGRFPPDLPAGYSVHQYEAAVKKHLEILQWHEPGIDSKASSSDAYRQMLDGPKVVVSGFEALKAQVKDAAVKPKVTPKTKAPDLAFINADQPDMEIAKTVQSQFTSQNVSTVLPLFNQTSSATRSDLEENLVESDVLVFIYGNARPEWIRSQLRLYNKMRPRRSTEPRALAICVGPPHDKPDLGMSISGSRVIDLEADAVNPIKHFLDELLR